MDIVGGGKAFVFPDQDELPHQPGPQESWQESFVIIWYDPTQSVGGFFRIGHEPNFSGGARSQIVANVFSPAGVFRRTEYLPLTSRHRLQNAVLTGDDTLRYEYDGKIRWFFDDQDIRMDLEVDNFVPAIDLHRRDGIQNAEGYLGAHVDAGCSVSGKLSVLGISYVIDNALAVRDHAWGPREWAGILAHRWTLATLDRENSFVAMSFLIDGAPLSKFGWVIRGDKVLVAEHIDIKATIGMDGATNFGGTTTMRLTTGEIFEAKFEPYYPAIATVLRNFSVYDSMSRVSWGDKVGFGVFETSCNSQGGTSAPQCYEGSYPATPAKAWHETKLLLAGS